MMNVMITFIICGSSFTVLLRGGYHFGRGGGESSYRFHFFVAVLVFGDFVGL